MGEEGVTYTCIGPRGLLTEEFAVQTLDNGDDSATLEFDDVPIGNAITEITSQFPSIIKRVQSLPVGSNIVNTYSGRTAEQVIKNMYLDTEYGWYIRPDGTLVSISRNLINPSQAKFGVYGTTVNSLNPQYNVMSSNLQFDVSKRYNRCIIEGAKKVVKKHVNARCLVPGFYPANYNINDDDYIAWSTLDFSKYGIDSEFKAVKVLHTNVDFIQVFKWHHIGITLATATNTAISLTDYEYTADNKAYHNWTDYETVTDDDGNATVKSTFHSTVRELPQGTLAADNTISFGQSMKNMFFPGVKWNGNVFLTIPVGSRNSAFCATV